MENKTKRQKTKSFKRQLVASILALIALPLTAAIVISSVAAIKNALSSQEEILMERSRIVLEQIEAIIEKNYLVLEGMAKNEQIISFLEDPEHLEYDKTRAVMMAANDAFADGNPMHLSIVGGDQLIRTDENECKNIESRAYFQKAMQGESNMSDVLVSLATGSLIDVIIVPVRNANGEVIGAVQRDYGLSVLGDFTNEAATGDSKVAIIESNGLLMSLSGTKVASEEDRTDYSETDFYQNALKGGEDGGTLVETINGTRMLFAYRQEPMTNWIIATTADYNSMMAKALKGPIIIIIVSVIMLIGAGLIGFYIAQRFSKPILAVSAVATAAAEGDLKERELNIHSRTEIGSMSRAFGEMTENFRGVIQKTRDASDHLSGESAGLQKNATKATDAAGHVSRAIDEISKGAMSQAASVQEAANHADNIGNDIDDIASNSGHLDSSSAEMSKACEAAMKALNELIKQSEEVTNSVSEIGSTIRSTNTSSQQISEFTDAIASIASQTNLLSLNASIEAARAGEAGKGFAVVAQEISKLAAQSSQSAEQIKSIVDLLLSNSESSVKVMDRLNADFAAQSEMLEATRQDMISLEQNAGNVAESAAQITAKVESLALAKDGLVGIINDLSAISEENAASAQETNASMQELNETFSRISSSSQKLQQLAGGLSETISYYSE
ncbi:MAG: HAMP domain-containing protein [Lachnospiraceae bacterium]|nr:HAMP domain-containing protein [Lachnospiraceae bacterium]